MMVRASARNRRCRPEERFFPGRGGSKRISCRSPSRPPRRKSAEARPHDDAKVGEAEQPRPASTVDLAKRVGIEVCQPLEERWRVFGRGIGIHGGSSNMSVGLTVRRSTVGTAGRNPHKAHRMKVGRGVSSRQVGASSHPTRRHESDHDPKPDAEVARLCRSYGPPTRSVTKRMCKWLQNRTVHWTAWTTISMNDSTSRQPFGHGAGLWLAAASPRRAEQRQTRLMDAALADLPGVAACSVSAGASRSIRLAW